jgi:hypothetical protein
LQYGLEFRLQQPFTIVPASSLPPFATALPSPGPLRPRFSWGPLGNARFGSAAQPWPSRASASCLGRRRKPIKDHSHGYFNGSRQHDILTPTLPKSRPTSRLSRNPVARLSTQANTKLLHTTRSYLTAPASRHALLRRSRQGTHRRPWQGPLGASLARRRGAPTSPHSSLSFRLVWPEPWQACRPT